MIAQDSCHPQGPLPAREPDPRLYLSVKTHRLVQDALFLDVLEDIFWLETYGDPELDDDSLLCRDLAALRSWIGLLGSGQELECHLPDILKDWDRDLGRL